MSSLRYESVRFSWLEAFVAVADEENFASAARQLGISESTVIFYVKWLQAWAGKSLIESSTDDSETADRKVIVTRDGREFYNIASSFIRSMNSFRSKVARARQEIDQMKEMLRVMTQDLKADNPSKTAQKLGHRIQAMDELVAVMTGEVPVDQLDTVGRVLRGLYSEYENERWQERRRVRVSSRTDTSTFQL